MLLPIVTQTLPKVIMKSETSMKQLLHVYFIKHVWVGVMFFLFLHNVVFCAVQKFNHTVCPVLYNELKLILFTLVFFFFFLEQ